jgi:hypothetical protein
MLDLWYSLYGYSIINNVASCKGYEDSFVS